MNALLTGLAGVVAAVPSPSPTSRVPDELEVTPGLSGFLATFAVAAAAVLLFLSLTRHLRTARSNAIERGIPVEEPRRHRFADEPGGDEPGSVQSPDVGPVGGPDGRGAGGDGPGSGDGPDTDGDGRGDRRGPAAP